MSERNDITLFAVNSLGLKAKSPITPGTKQMFFHCPHHIDKTPSMSINFDKGIYNCFSCGKGGSIESLYWDLTGKGLRKEMGLGKKDKFSSFARGDLYSYDTIQEDTSLKNVSIDINWEDMEPAHYNRVAKGYLLNRGITNEVIKDLSMMYTSLSYINKTPFRNRIIIPIYENKKLIAVEGRRLSDDPAEPKVLYCKGGTVNTLYDIDNLDKNSTVYAVEGLMDLAVLRTCDTFKNSTCIFGANLTKRQISLIEGFKKFVYIPDNDTAGENTVKKLKEAGLPNTYILRLPKKLNNIDIKDIGDLGIEGIPLEYLLLRKWLNYEKKL